MSTLYYGLILDGIILAIVVIYIILGIKNGFVKAAVGFAGIILAAYLAFTLSGALSVGVYDNIIEPAIVKKVTTENKDAATNSVTGTVNKVYNGLPNFVKNYAQKKEITEQSVVSDIDNTYGAEAQSLTEKVVTDVSKKMIRPVALEIIKSVIGTVIFIGLMIVVRILAKVISKAVKLAGLKKYDGTLGGLLGFLKGVLAAAIICTVISVLVNTTGVNVWVISKDGIEKSYIFGFLATINPFY